MKIPAMHSGIRTLLAAFFAIFTLLAVQGQEQDFIPIDYKGEAPSSHIGYMPNKG